MGWVHLLGTTQLLFESVWKMPPFFPFHIYVHLVLTFYHRNHQKPASQRDEVIERNTRYSHSENTWANSSCNVQASLFCLKGLKYPELHLWVCCSTPWCLRAQDGDQSVKGSPLPAGKSLQAWYTYSLPLKEYRIYIRIYKKKILLVSGETNQGAGRHGGERKKFALHYTASYNFAILSFLCGLYIQKNIFKMPNAKRSIKCKWFRSYP